MAKDNKDKTAKTPTRQRITRKQIVAYHEAGHAVMRHILGHGFRSISTVEGKDGSEGRVMNKACPRVKFWTKAAAIHNEEEIMALLSGMAATCILRRRRRIGVAETILQGDQDWDRAYKLAMYRCSAFVIGDQETERYIEWLETRTLNMLRRCWRAVVALADAVAGGKELCEEQAVRIINRNLGGVTLVHEKGDWEIQRIKPVRGLASVKKSAF
jgi:hypothetical protein